MIAPSAIHGRGAFPKHTVRFGDYLFVEGYHVKRDRAIRGRIENVVCIEPDHTDCVYAFSTDSLGRFCNHSSTPNGLFEWFSDGLWYRVIAERIYFDQELTVDYGDSYNWEEEVIVEVPPFIPVPPFAPRARIRSSLPKDKDA